MDEYDNILEMHNITKNFTGVRALDDVSIELKKGEVLGIIGQNGAGKSTLIKILSGDLNLERGEIFIEGNLKIFKNPLHSLESGIRVIYQELSLLENLSVAENLFLGEFLFNKFGFIDWKSIFKESKEILDKFEININPYESIENLKISEKQIIEILRAIRKKAKILVMDEPTSAIDEKSTAKLHQMINKIKNEGLSIIYISHRIEEILNISDKIIVLRDGKKVAELLKKETNKSQLINLLIGKDVSEQYPKKLIKKGRTVLEVNNLSYFSRLKNVSFKLFEGEILGFFGLLGSGIDLLFSILFGDRKRSTGEILINAKEINSYNPYIAKNKNVGFIPFDRKNEGLALQLGVKHNITAANIDRLGKLIFFNKKLEIKHSDSWVNKLSIKTPTLETPVCFLSGGNQQKIVISKWLECNSKIIIMNDPTRGIDIGSKKEIYSIVENLCEDGAGILFSSTELSEIMAITSRIIVFKNGEKVGEFATENTEMAEIMHSATY